VPLKFDTYSLKLGVAYSLGKLPREYVAGMQMLGSREGPSGCRCSTCGSVGSGRLEGASPPPHGPLPATPSGCRGGALQVANNWG
jgi:hypothetical protein